jgi:hypothetical protein
MYTGVKAKPTEAISEGRVRVLGQFVAVLLIEQGNEGLGTHAKSTSRQVRKVRIWCLY